MSSLSFPKRILIKLLRFFFKILYHQFAWTYDWVASIVSLGAWHSWVISVSPYVVGPKTLEIGFGPGHLQASLNQKGITTFGLDESEQMARITQRRLHKLGFPQRLARGDAIALPFANGCFNQVVMTFPAEYILNTDAFTEIQRVLPDGGSVILLPLAWITGRKPWERLVAWINHITGEAPDWDEKSLEPLRTVGYEVSWEKHEYKTSQTLIIRMIKTYSKN